MLHFKNAALIISCFFCSMLAHAQSGELDKRTPSAYFGADGTFLTHKSDTVVATDFDSGYNLELGVWTGKNRTLGMALRQSAGRTRFTQGDATTAATWTDFLIRYRIAWFYPALLVGSCDLEAEAAGVDKVDLLCTSVGGSIGLRVPIGPYVIVALTPTFAQPVAVKDRLARDTKTGLRSDVELATSLRPKLEWLDINVGFRYRSYELEVAGEASRETYAGPFVGLTFGLTF